MKEIIETLDRWRERGDRIAVATVIETRRSAPRSPGTKMAVNDRGEIAGSVSGGCVEGAVATAAAEVIECGEPQLLAFGVSDDEAWGVGLPCGGEIDVWLERYR